MIEEAKKYATLKYADHKQGLYLYNGFIDAIQWLEDKKKSNDCIIDVKKCTVSYKGKQYVLQKVPFKVLEILCNNKGKVVTRDEIYDYVWGPDVFVVPQSIEVQILKIRKTLPNIPVITKKGIGYILEK